VNERERLRKLRMVTESRGATPAEAATARRMADTLERRIGPEPRVRLRRRYVTEDDDLIYAGPNRRPQTWTVDPQGTVRKEVWPHRDVRDVVRYGRRMG